MSAANPWAELESSDDDFWDEDGPFGRGRRYDDDDGVAANGRKKRKKEERKREGRFADKYPQGDLRRTRLPVESSPWWDLINHADVRDEASPTGMRFRRKFRLPMVLVERIVASAQRVAAFKDKPVGAGHGRGPPRHPLMIKVLAWLRHIGKGSDADELEDAARISAVCLRAFFRDFGRWFEESWYLKLVKLPDGDKARRSMRVYEKMGFPGAFCETDGVHVAWANCAARQKPRFVGKEGYPTVAFDVSVTHNHEVINIADWCAGAVNDKTQAVHDQLLQDLHSGTIMPEHVFQLYDEHGVLHDWKGVYTLVDAGYYLWRCLICPLKHAAGDSAAAWSEKLESIRKGVECTFGILKKRFRILAQDFEVRHAADIQTVFRNCCALHNMLLKHDKLNTMGERPGDWVTAREYLARQNLELSRSRHVVRAPSNLSGATGQREAGHAKLREALIKHFEYTSKHGLNQWLRPAAHTRARPHLPYNLANLAGADPGDEHEMSEEEEEYVSPDDEEEEADDEDDEL